MINSRVRAYSVLLACAEKTTSPALRGRVEVYTLYAGRVSGETRRCMGGSYRTRLQCLTNTEIAIDWKS